MKSLLVLFAYIKSLPTFCLLLLDGMIHKTLTYIVV